MKHVYILTDNVRTTVGVFKKRSGAERAVDSIVIHFPSHMRAVPVYHDPDPIRILRKEKSGEIFFVI